MNADIIIRKLLNYASKNKENGKDNSHIIRKYFHKQSSWGWRSWCLCLMYSSASVLAAKHWELQRRRKETVPLGFRMVLTAVMTSCHHHYFSSSFLIYSCMCSASPPSDLHEPGGEDYTGVHPGLGRTILCFHVAQKTSGEGKGRTLWVLCYMQFYHDIQQIGWTKWLSGHIIISQREQASGVCPNFM